MAGPVCAKTGSMHKFIPCSKDLYNRHQQVATSPAHFSHLVFAFTCPRCSSQYTSGFNTLWVLRCLLKNHCCTKLLCLWRVLVNQVMVYRTRFLFSSTVLCTYICIYLYMSVCNHGSIENYKFPQKVNLRSQPSLYVCLKLPFVCTICLPPCFLSHTLCQKRRFSVV